MNRFSEPRDPDFDAINRSLDVDRRLWPYDIAQSRAHVAMLAAQGIISAEDAGKIHDALTLVEGELAADLFKFEQDDEDIHMAIERRVTELAGDAGGRIHTARSRNDQVATDLVLFTRDAARETVAQIERLMSALIDAAEAHIDWPMPGYTHLQRAQPVYLSHHLLAYVWMLDRDRQRFAFVASQCDVLPLGAGALAGVNFDTDRALVAKELDLGSVSPNSLDAVSNRDFVIDYLSAAATSAAHLSRLGAELVLWSSQEFAFVELPDRWTSGSSLMPQKKNPDAAELLRSKAPRMVGNLSSFLGVLHGLPLAYNKDMQEDKEPLFDALNTWHDCINATADMLARARWQKTNLLNALDKGFLLATDLADALVNSGVPFRQAHEMIAELVGELTHGRLTFVKFGAGKIAQRFKLDEALVRDTLNIQKALKRRDLPGAPHPKRVKAAARVMAKRSVLLDKAAEKALRPMPVEKILAET